MSSHPLTPGADRRANLPIQVYRMGEEPGDDLSGCTTPEERIALVWELTRRMWTLAGRGLPDAPRDRLPVRIIRPA